MTDFLLVRHGRNDLVDEVLLGRSDLAGLSSAGRRQIRDLSAILARRPVDLIQTSPRLRCLETASELAAALGADVEEVPALDEVDYGAWTGLPFRILAEDPAWQAWNERRDAARPPGGERMRDVQIRVVRHMQCVSAVYPDGRVVFVTHAEVIRAALLHQDRMPLREYWRIGVEPGTVRRIEYSLERRVAKAGELFAP